MSVISDGFKLGNIILDKKYVKTRDEIVTLGGGDGEGYPEVFPIWCSTDNSLYIFYKTEDGKVNIADYNKIATSDKIPVLYPVVDEETSTMSWEIRTVDEGVPDPVEIKGTPGPSAYDSWIAIGNTGTEEDFVNSLKMTPATMTESDIDNLKIMLGITTMSEQINTLQAIANELT